MTLVRKGLLALCAATLTLSASAAPGEKGLVDQGTDLSIPAPAIDSGLGELPPFETWTDPWLYAIPGEHLDSGLGSLPPYSEWQYPWLYSMPAKKIDTGLGEIRPITVSEKSASPERPTP